MVVRAGAIEEQQPLAGLEAKRSMYHATVTALGDGGHITSELFGIEEADLTRQMETLRNESQLETEAANEQDELARRFEEVLLILQDLDLEQVWTEASDPERRVLVDELLDRLVVFPDHLEVVVHGAPKLNVLLSEVGLAESQNARVGGPIPTLGTALLYRGWVDFAA